jgi:arylformamidase
VSSLYDVSVPIRQGMPVFPGDPEVHLERVTSLAAGAVCNLSRADLGVHSGTHIDAPSHFIDGAPAIEGVPVDVLIGPCLVTDMTRLSGNIDAGAIASLDIPAGVERILFKTANSELWAVDNFPESWVGLTPDGAAELLRRGVRLVGIDFLSIAPKGDPTPTHVALLEQGVVILEGADLRRVQPGQYELFCLPILLVGSDGAPARILLRD